MSNDTMRRWEALRNPGKVKDVPGKGRKVTAIDTYGRIKDWTREYGPVGEGWGAKLLMTNLVPGAGDQPPMFWVAVEVWVRGQEDEDRDGSWCAMGSSEVYRWIKNPGKYVNDVEFPKKAFTDAMTKAMSYAGSGADVYLGKFEDSRYMHEHNKQAEAQEAREDPEVQRLHTSCLRLLDCYKDMPGRERKAVLTKDTATALESGNAAWLEEIQRYLRNPTLIDQPPTDGIPPEWSQSVNQDAGRPVP